MGAFIDLTNKTFGRLTVLNIESNTNGIISWLCQCNCENKTRLVVLGSSLRSGKTKSCGCISKENVLLQLKTHGLSNTSIYNSWSSMKSRCNNPKSKDYHLYGGRGIKYDFRWESFENFYEDMGSTWFENGTIDRIDTNGNYTKDNCRWITIKEQQRNKNNNIYVIIEGEKLTLSQVSQQFNIHYQTIVRRYNSGKRDEELILPIHNKSEFQSNVKGVSWDKNSARWIARIQIEDKMKKLGSFINVDEAIKSRLQFEKIYFNQDAPQKHLFEKYNI